MDDKRQSRVSAGEARKFNAERDVRVAELADRIVESSMELLRFERGNVEEVYTRHVLRARLIEIIDRALERYL